MAKKRQRREIARRLKELGLGRLYTGNKKLAWRRIKVPALRKMLAFSPGDVVNDCDYFNHVIKCYMLDRWQKREGGAIDVDQVEFEDGRYSCGCPCSPTAPWTWEQVEQAWRNIFASSPDYNSEVPFYVSLREALNRNERITDDRGVLLPHLVELRNTPW